MNDSSNIEICCWKTKNIVDKGKKKCWLPAYSPFPTTLLKFDLSVITTRNSVVELNPISTTGKKINLAPGKLQFCH